MFRFLLPQDIARLYRNGLLLGACWRAISRPFFLIGCAAIALVFFFVPHTVINAVLLGFLTIFAIGIHLTDCVVNKITPLCFGTFLIGRLNRKYVIRARYWFYRAEFTLIPSAEQLVVKDLVLGKEGMTYLLVRHPTEFSIVLPIIDDDPGYMRMISLFATDERKTEIATEIARLRQETS